MSIRSWRLTKERWPSVLACLLTWAILACHASPATAQGQVAVTIAPGSLENALLTLSDQAGTDILFDPDLAKGLRTAGIRGRFTPQTALQTILDGTGLAARRTAAGTFVIERPGAAPLERQDAPAPEILVIGRRSQNADIRRMETDVQPYRVVGGTQILQSDRDNLGHYFQSRVPADTLAVMPSLGIEGFTQSQIELRGLTSDDTLILIDGRRMPRTPLPYVEFWQPDLNALPLNAIDRVEVLTGTAGGIYGFGALGGVVNTVIAGDRRGGEIHFRSGLSARGDAFQYAIEGGFATTLGDGRTAVRVFASQSRADPLVNRDRDYLARDAQLVAGNLSGNAALAGSSGHAVEFRNIVDAPLQLKPDYGGTTLASRNTFIDVGGALSRDGIVSSLSRNAGKVIDAPLSNDLDSWISAAGRSKSLLANIRHRFDDGFEVYVDAVVLRNEGYIQGSAVEQQGRLVYRADDPANPFTSDTLVIFPIDAAIFTRRVTIGAERYTAGLIAPLPGGWRANAELTLGSASFAHVSKHVYSTGNFGALSPLPDPLGAWNQFNADIAPALMPVVYDGSVRSRYRDLTLRLAGSLFKTAAGHATLSVAAERRIESIPTYYLRDPFDNLPTAVPKPSYRNATTSFSAELRVPLFDQNAPSPFLRGLKAQLALRNDREVDDFARDPASVTSERRQASFPATAYTIGLKATPAPWLMLRASYAAGSTPPPVTALIQWSFDGIPLNDPKRGNMSVITGDGLTYLEGGSPDLGVIKATTLSFGAAITPFGPEGPRLTLDYSRIRKADDIVYFYGEIILALEEKFADRVVRDSLTEADRALGYTGGVLRRVDARAANAGRLTVETLDARLEWRLPVGTGALRLYGDATYYIRQLASSPIQDPTDLVGYLRRPLRWRGNAGAEWSAGALTIGANAQHFDSYRIVADPRTDTNPNYELAQGGPRVPAQTYVDVHAGWRFRHFKLDIGIANLFDASPARETRLTASSVPSVGYSRFGDPRRRRFVLNLGASF